MCMSVSVLMGIEVTLTTRGDKGEGRLVDQMQENWNLPLATCSCQTVAVDVKCSGARGSDALHTTGLLCTETNDKKKERSGLPRLSGPHAELLPHILA
jgi:hypothetical protein